MVPAAVVGDNQLVLKFVALPGVRFSRSAAMIIIGG